MSEKVKRRLDMTIQNECIKNILFNISHIQTLFANRLNGAGFTVGMHDGYKCSGGCDRLHKFVESHSPVAVDADATDPVVVAFKQVHWSTGDGRFCT